MSTSAIDFRPIRAGEPHALLAGVWRRIMRDFDLDKPRLDDLLSEHVRKLTYMDSEKQLQYRGNVLSDLLAESLTWGTFLRGLRGIGVRSVEIELRLHHLKYATVHKLPIEFPGYDVDPEARLPGQKDLPPTELHYFFMAIMRDLGMSIDDINNYLTRYMIRARIPLTSRNKTSMRGNVKKDIFQQRLSWTSFVRGLNFLEITKFEIELHLQFKNHKSKHRHVIILNDPEDLIEELRDLIPPEDLNDFTIPTETTAAADDSQRPSPDGQDATDASI